MDKKELPSGIDSFREIREGNYYYVDKTDFAKRLIDGDKHNFLSRPRRFGKSLFVDTLKICSGATSICSRGFTSTISGTGP